MIRALTDQIRNLLSQLDQLEKPLGGTAPTPPPSIQNADKLLVIVDAGHGGMHPETGRYMTNPRDGKFYTFTEDNFTAYEGQTNRLIADRFCEMMAAAGINHTKIYHEFLDTPLATLAQRANEAHRNFLAGGQGRKTILLSFHSNAIGMTNRGPSQSPNFFSVWTTRGTTRADRIATEWLNQQRAVCGNAIQYGTDMTDGDPDYEADFTILFATHMPAVLVENLFFTNREGARLLYSKDYQDKSAQAAFNTVRWCLDNIGAI